MTSAAEIRALIAGHRQRTHVIKAHLHRINTLARLTVRLPPGLVKQRDDLLSELVHRVNRRKGLEESLREHIDTQLQQERKAKLSALALAAASLPPEPPKNKRESCSDTRLPKVTPPKIRMQLPDDRRLPLAVTELTKQASDGSHLLQIDATYQAAAILRSAPWALRQQRQRSRRWEGFQRGGMR